MSWSVQYSNIDVQKDTFDFDHVQPFGDTSDEVREQFEAAVEAVVELAASRVVGYGHKFNVSLSGHANPGHAPAKGWANDMVTVSISQATDGS